MTDLRGMLALARIRAESLGHIGTVLLTVLAACPKKHMRVFASSSFNMRTTLLTTQNMYTNTVRTALSLLCCDFPIQLDLDSRYTTVLLTACFSAQKCIVDNVRTLLAYDVKNNKYQCFLNISIESVMRLYMSHSASFHEQVPACINLQEYLTRHGVVYHDRKTNHNATNLWPQKNEYRTSNKTAGTHEPGKSANEDSIHVVLTNGVAFPNHDSGQVKAAVRLNHYVSSDCNKPNYLPYKTGKKARDKANMHYCDILTSIRSNSNGPDIQYIHSHALLNSFTNDQGCAALLLSLSLRQFYSSPGDLACAVVSKPNDAKGATIVIKALGLHRYAQATVLCEGQALQGRGVGDVDILAHARARCDENSVNATIAHFTRDELRPVIRRILQEELGDAIIKYDSPQTHWTRRWGWFVNGSHAPPLLQDDRPSELQCFQQVYRRMYAEYTDKTPTAGWDGTTLARASLKFEHGKTRVLYACDSRSYVAFSHLLSPVERVWRSRRVDLDPGKLGHVGIAKRINLLRQEGGSVNIMLDYDDFNSAHSNEAMATVIEELGTYVGYDKLLLQPLVDSFYRNYLIVGGKCVGQSVGTLMSGHRGTTFLNSVLNAAYIRLAIGDSLYTQTPFLHVGDDIYAAAMTYEHAAEIVTRCRDAGLHMNPLKQSIGAYTAEFLRLAITDSHARGYLPRAIASAVSGNWTTDTILQPNERVQSLVLLTRTLINRGYTRIYSDIISRATHNITGCPHKILSQLLSGHSSYNGGPVYAHATNPQLIKFEGKTVPWSDDIDVMTLPRMASDDYITNHMKPLELYATATLGIDFRPAMADASYSKARPASKVDLTSYSFKAYNIQRGYGDIALSVAIQQPRDVGILCNYPLLHLVKEQLSNTQLVDLLRLAGYIATPDTAGRLAWGAEATISVINGIASYADASRAANNVACSTIRADFPVYM